MPKIDCIQKLLERLFYKYGKLVGRHPLPFIIGPVLLTLVLSFGLLNFVRIDDAEELYTPTNGPAKEEREIIRDRFPENDSFSFIPTRRTSLDGTLQVIVTAKDNGNVKTSEGVETVLQVEELIQNVSIEHNGQVYHYSDLCAAWKQRCVENGIVYLFSRTHQDPNNIDIKYPFHTQGGTSIFVGSLFGGVTTTADNVIETVKAMYLLYSVQYQTSEDQVIGDKFLRKCVEELHKMKTNEETEISYQASMSLDDEVEAATDGIVALFSVTYFVLTFFASISCSMLDQVRSKSWVATGGELAAALAILSSLGLLSAAGVPVTSTVGSMPFLIIGIGIDDMFVIISSWRHTSYTWSVEERMGKTFETAAISITVTSITDALAFGIGAVTTFKAVTYFCAYAGVAVLFSYIYAVTFCAACLSYSGKIEHRNRHSTACCIQMLPRTAPEYKSKSGCFKALCTGGDEVHLEEIPNSQLAEKQAINNSNHVADIPQSNSTQDRFALPLIAELIGSHIAPFILKTGSKIVVIGLYIVYLALSIWGCLSLKEGLHVKNLAPDGSYVIQFFNLFDQYFYSQYGPKVMVAFTDPLDYYNLSVQADIEHQLQIFRNNEYFETENNLTESWLNQFSKYLTETRQTPVDMTTFIHVLRTQFLKISPFDRFSVDIDFNDDFTSIISSRFMLQSKGVSSSLDEKHLTLSARDIASKSPYNITVFAAGFIFFDQYVVIVANTLQNLGIAVVCMMVVAVVLLPSLVGIVFVTLSVVSICTGVVGFMVFWNVSLDSISMINLIMCIGFSVDFSAHISYHFAVGSNKSGDGRAVEALTYMGWPVIQGALSTILGVIVLAFSNTYIFRTFFKIMFLVMVFGFFHAFFVLPVVLSLTYTAKRRLSGRGASATSDSNKPSYI